MTEKTRSMLSGAEQIAALEVVAQLVGRHECNCVITGADNGDVAYLAALFVASPSQVTHPIADAGYDIWRPGPEGLKLFATAVSAERAAHEIVCDYLSSKAARMKQLRPELDIKVIVDALMKGYQHGSGIIVRVPADE